MYLESWLQLCFSGIFYELALNSHLIRILRVIHPS
ncbi:hypothetical protein BCL69_10982 [Nitrosomonas communis]|uniref:Uncharacterized protein n=1 Tax=Nitrosomonas communis TaxID=44574 RepID=A0A5D3Y9N1_9PROT|nr:hypothetical protein BCL69_10982 [Nitrosomonas communis]